MKARTMLAAADRFSLQSWRKLSPTCIVFLLALLARLWVMYRAADTPDFLPEQGDMKFYSDWARRIAAGTWTDHQAFYGLPGYAYWLALVYTVVGYQPYLAVLCQALAEACTATLLFQLGPLAFTRAGEETDPAGRRRARSVGALAALGWIFCEPAQTYATVLMPTSYLIAAFWFVAWWVLRRWRAGRPSLAAFLGLGVLMGVVAMMVANILFLIPFVLAAILLRRDWSPVDRLFTPGRRAGAAVLLVGGVVLGASPCALHNYLLAHEPVFLSAHSGINFFIGNNALANGYPQVPPPLHTDQHGMLRDSILWAERASGHPLRRVEVSAFWSHLASQYIHEHPAAWLRLLLTKLGNFWNGFPYDDLGVMQSFQENGLLLPGIGFGTAAVLGLPGMLWAAVRRPKSRWIIAAVGLHMASLLTVFVTERYRLAAVPGLLLLGAFGLVELWREIAAGTLLRPRHRAAAAGYALVLVAAVVVTNRPVDPAVRHINDYNGALADIDNHRLDRAQGKLTRVLADNPNNAETYFALGNVALDRGNRDLAKYYYRRTLQLDPAHFRVLNNLGLLALEEKRWPLAETFLDHALTIEPDDAKAQYLLAVVRWERADLPGAHAAIAEAQRLNPADTQFRKLAEQLDAGHGAPPSLDALFSLP